MIYQITINGKLIQLDIEQGTPLLWVIRDHLQLTGTKFGCGLAQCGACTVHLDGRAIRSCVTPVELAEGKRITTIEGAAASDYARETIAVQRAWQALSVVQCGYCQSGQIMSAAALLANNPQPTDQAIDKAMSGNICRCSTYIRIKKAIKQAADSLTNNTIAEEENA